MCVALFSLRLERAEIRPWMHLSILRYDNGHGHSFQFKVLERGFQRQFLSQIVTF